MVMTTAGTPEARILLAEDDPAIVELTRFTLESAGFALIQVRSAEEAIVRLRDTLPDAALIDWMLPGMSGLALARHIRGEARTHRLPIIMVTARAEEADRIAGLDGGADDYLTKPYSPRELIARIRAVLRRETSERGLEPIRVGALVMDPVSYTVQHGERPLRLGPTEFRLLRFMMSQPGRAFTRAQLRGGVWGDRAFIEERTIDVHIRRLRQALGPEGESLVESVRGIGYRMARVGT